MDNIKLLDPKHKIVDLSFIDIKPMGFIEPEDNPDDFKFGATTKIPDEILREDGQYLDVQIEKEYQRKYGTETMGCTFFGTNNATEIIAKVKYPNDPEMNNSDRAGNILAGNTTGGNNPKKPAEVLNSIGIPKETSLPFDNTCTSWGGYHSPKPLPQNLLKECAEWKDKWLFLYAWVNVDKQSLKRALRRGPLGISVQAWMMRNGMYYNDNNNTNHWVSLIGYEEGKCWYIFDSYDSFIKKLEWNYNFGYAMQYYLKKKVNEEEETTPQNKNMNLTAKFRTEPAIYVKSNTHPKNLLWICNPDPNNDSYKNYKTMISEGLIPPEGQEEILEDGTKASYTILNQVINLDYNPDMPITTNWGWFSKFIQSIFGKK